MLRRTNLYMHLRFWCICSSDENFRVIFCTPIILCTSWTR